MLPTLIQQRAALAICGLSLVLAAVPARALDPHTALAQYGYQSWQTDTGLPQNTVHAIVQGRDGYLWIATEGGLVRFDGVDFRAYTRANTPGLPSDLMDDLLEDRSGALWISTSGGLARMRGGKAEAFGPAQGVPPTQVWRTFEDAHGTVWALTAAGLFRIDGEHGDRVALDAGLTENSRMAAGADGSLWLGTADGLMRENGKGAFEHVGDTGEVLALGMDAAGHGWAGLRSGLEMCGGSDCHRVAIPQSAGAVHAIVRDGQGRMWVGTDGGLYVATNTIQSVGQTGRVDSLYCDERGMVWAGTAHGLMRIAADGRTELLRGGDVFLSAAQDREGDLWLGTESGGLAVLRDRKFSALTAEDGLTDEYVLALAQAPDGEVWAATKGGGLNVYRDGKFHAVTTVQGLTSNVVLAVAAAPNGDVWAGTPDGLDLIRGNTVRAFTTADGLADDFVRSLYVGSDGELWIGTRRGLSRYEGGKFTTWSALDGLGSDLIGAMVDDREGNLWIGTLGGLSRFRDGHFTNFTTKDGLSSNVVTALYADRDGTLWIGTNDGGLNRWKDGRIASLASAQIPNRVIGILEDSSGFLWISSNTGVYRARRDGLNRMAEGGARAEVMRFGVADGMRISECSSGGHPAAMRLREGALWFATLKGIAFVDPEHMPVNRVPPEVAIERVNVDDAPQASMEDLTVKPGHSHYEFDYAGLSFVAPQKVEYRYQLEGFDRDWVDAGTRRTAFYTNLPHGRYTFRVSARNNDGVWSKAAAAAVLTIEPHLYQTVWFRLLVLLALAGLGYAAWRRRLQRVEREFQAVLGERTRIAREIHDTLAQGFVAVSVHLELVAQLMRNSVDAAREQLERAQALVRSSLDDARTSIWELRSQGAEQGDLAARILKTAEEVTASAGAQHADAPRARVQMHVTGTNHPLDEDVERELTRIAREAVTNAVRHGEAANIVLRLEFEGSMFGMEIRDDGRGFAGAPPDGTSGHFGLTGMRERAQAIGSALTVESEPGEGTTVRLALPLSRETEKSTQL
ncbi:MAG TPA: two-component regulator propeller domain-containing protein [Acidobacteriaceae bacterium]|nr:two-component regulator propeller domain-containing protein [Acidobacteriaceae bacterium]